MKVSFEQLSIEVDKLMDNFDITNIHSTIEKVEALIIASGWDIDQFHYYCPDN